LHERNDSERTAAETEMARHPPCYLYGWKSKIPIRTLHSDHADPEFPFVASGRPALSFRPLRLLFTDLRLRSGNGEYQRDRESSSFCCNKAKDLCGWMWAHATNNASIAAMGATYDP